MLQVASNMKLYLQDPVWNGAVKYIAQGTANRNNLWMGTANETTASPIFFFNISYLSGTEILYL